MPRTMKSDLVVAPQVVEGPDFFSPQVIEARRFFVDLQPNPLDPLAVVSGGREQTSPDYHISRDTFPYMGVEFVAGGEGLIRMGEVQHQVSAGAVFTYGPTVPQEMTSNPRNPLVKYFVDFACMDLEHVLPSPAPRPGQIVQTSMPDKIMRLFEDLIDAGLRKSRFQRRICVTVLEQLLLRIAETAVPLGTIGTEAFDTYRLCRQYIDKHYRQLASLPEVAAECHVDPAYVCRLFKRFDHQSPWQYIMELKMREAAARLQRPGVLVKNIATELGFADAFQFSRTFRRVLGVSPRRFLQFHRHP